MKGLDSIGFVVVVVVVVAIFETVRSNGRRRKCWPEIWPDYWPQTAYQLLSGHLLKDDQWNWRNSYFLIFK